MTWRTLITGAGGFVGARLAEQLLTAGVDTQLMIRPGSDAWRLEGLRQHAPVIEVDLRDPEAVRRAVDAARVDAIFHLAANGAYSWQTQARTILETNLLGMLHLLEAALQAGVGTVVNAGSSSEYGFKDHAPAEDEVLVPNSHYAVAKAASTMLGQHVAEQSRLAVTTLRLSSVYGPWENPGRLVPTLIAKGFGGTLPPLVAPETARDFVHVDDVCRAFITVARIPRPPSRIYNIGSGRQTTVGELVELARRHLGIDAQPEWETHAARSWDATVWFSDPARAKRELGWRAGLDLEDGFRDTVTWLQEHPRLWKRYGVDRAPDDA